LARGFVDDLLERRRFVLGPLHEIVEVVDVRLVMLAVVERDGIGADDGLERVFGPRQRGKREHAKLSSVGIRSEGTSNCTRAVLQGGLRAAAMQSGGPRAARRRSPRSVAVQLLHALAALLRFERKRGRRARDQAGHADRLAGLLAPPVAA